jgi:hypothetical protein
VADVVREGASDWIDAESPVGRDFVRLRVEADIGSGGLTAFELMRLRVAAAVRGLEDGAETDVEVERTKGAVRVDETAIKVCDEVISGDGVPVNDGTGPGVFV